jgi:hypothetical protein
MKALKIIGLIILGFLLFVSLSVFGLAFTLNSTILNTNFFPNELDRLNVASLSEEVLNTSDQSISPEIHDAIIRAIKNLEPQVKAHMRAANTEIYVYVLGQKTDIDMHQVLKDTVLKKDFVKSLLIEADTLTLVRDQLRNELADMVPSDQPQLINYLDQAMPSLDPWLKEQIDVVTSPVIDYLVGDSQNLQVSISLEPMKTTLKSSLRNAFLNSPPPELAGASQAQLDLIFNQYYQAFADQIPEYADIDPSTVGINDTNSWTQSLTDFEDGLTSIRTVVGYFRLVFILLIVFIVLVISGIILIHREVKGAARDLGIIFLTVGLIEFLEFMIGKYIVNSSLTMADIPTALATWLPGLYADLFRPLEIFSMVLLIGGAGLIVLSILYRRHPVQAGPPTSDHPA